MNTICAPSQVMRDGRDLNQHGQAGRQEQASSSSPVIFHGVLSAAAAALAAKFNALRTPTIATVTRVFLEMLVFIKFVLSLKGQFPSRDYSEERDGQKRK